MPDPIDFIARRHAAIQAEREQRLEWEAEEELRKNINAVQYEFEGRMERDRAQRRKYWEVMVQKRASTSRRDPAA
jgi:hypothetical protein